MNVSCDANNKLKNHLAKDYAEDTSLVLKPLDERVSENVLQKGLAVCDGYARLFKTICDYTGIQVVIITDYGRTDQDCIGTKFFTNHTWNAVYFDSAWHLLDVTWASGYTSYFGNDYIQHLDEHYYLTPPAGFIRDHYPEDSKWTLLPQVPLVQEYKFSPFKRSGFIRSRIKSYYTAKGVIDAAIGDRVVIAL